MKFNFFLLVYIIWGNFALQAQTTVPTVIPVSPNAAALGKYGEIPVGLYTGIPKIEVPIYNINIDNTSIPVTLNYHAGGVKVEEIASWVGLGWSLNSGGVISRTIRGKDDLTSSIYYENVQDFMSRASDNNYGSFFPQNLDQLDYMNNTSTNSSFDFEPDVFYFNFGNYSGKFVLYPDGNYYGLPLNNIKIERKSVTGGKTGGCSQPMMEQNIYLVHQMMALKKL